MKSRNTTDLNRLSLKYSDSDVREVPQKNRKKFTNSSFIQRSTQLLQNYGTLLKKLPYQFGDAESYFKQTLRNYDELDFKSIKWEAKSQLKNYKSLDNLRVERKRSVTGSGDTKDKSKAQLKAQQKKSQTSTASKSKEKHEEEDADIFYSPSSQLTTESQVMAEEAEDTPVTSDFPEESENPTTDPLTATEELAEQASAEITKLEEDAGVHGGEVLGVSGGEGEETEASTAEDISNVEVIPVEELPTDMPEITVEQEGEAEQAIKLPVEELPPTPPQQPSKQPSKEPIPPVEEPGKPSTNIILKEVQKCEAQCAEIAVILVELRTRIATLINKPSRTPEEDHELEMKQALLNEKMKLLEQKTKRVEMLMLQSKMQNYDQPQSEDVLPKVIICGLTENNMPKIIVCDGKKKKRVPPKLTLPSQQICSPPMTQRPPPTQQYQQTCPPCMPTATIMPQFAQRLSECYNMQEKLAAENADLEGKRYQLQEDLLDKDQTVESLQRKLTTLQGEMRLIIKENNLLNDKIDKFQSPQVVCSKGDSPRHRKKKMPCGKGRGICPADVEGRLNEYSETTQQLEKQLTEMEDEVRTMQSELIAVRQERMHLEQHRRMMSCPNACITTPSCPAAFSPCPGMPPCPGAHPCSAPPCQRPPPCPTCCPAPCNINRQTGPSVEQMLRELREKYNYLQEDYKGKLTEVAGLRAEVDKLKQNALDGEQAKKLCEEKSKECARLLKECRETKKLANCGKEQTTELEQQLSVAKQRYREVKDELEEVRALVEEHKGQMEEYRNKPMGILLWPTTATFRIYNSI